MNGDERHVILAVGEDGTVKGIIRPAFSWDFIHEAMMMADPSSEMCSDRMMDACNKRFYELVAPMHQKLTEATDRVASLRFEVEFLKAELKKATKKD